MKQSFNNIKLQLRTEALLSLVVGGLLFALFGTAIAHHRRQPEPDIVELQPIVVFPDFASIADVRVKKQMFFDFIETYVNGENLKVEKDRARLLALSDITTDGVRLSAGERDELVALADRYDLDILERRENEIVFELFKRVDTIPVSLALAQAANESAWGTSRFAVEANNIFGQWCYDQGCGIVPSQRDSNASHEVRSFDTIEAAISSYFLNLNTHSRYEQFRNMRFQMRNQRGEIDPLVLAYGLTGYSERGDSYVDEVQTIIQQNDLINKYKI